MRKLILLTILLFGLKVQAQPWTFTTSTTWTCPAGVTTVSVECWGAGGGGGYGGTGNKNGGGGGGGGAYVRNASVTVVPGTTYNITVGTGGAGGNSGNGANGNSSIAIFGATTVTAQGGFGGSSHANGGNAGNGGSGTFNGGNGANGSASLSGGGGGGAGSTGNGGNATNETAGIGAALNGGNGGAGSTANSANGSVGANYGGGGGGGTRNSLGGNGANGYIVISLPGCIASTSFGTVSAPTDNLPVTISTATYAGEYNTINTVAIGETYQFASSNTTDYLTLTDASNTVLAFGTTPLTWTATFSGTVRLHVHTSSACGTESVSRTTTVTCTTCPIACAAPTTVTAAASPAGPVPVPTSVTFDYVSHTGGSCAGNWEYQWETTTGTVLQAWSTTSSYTTTVSANVSYVLRMRCSLCPTAIRNSNTVTVLFGSAPANNECNAAIPLTVNPNAICASTTPGTIQMATASAQTNDCYGTANDDVWYSFVATHTTHYISLLNITGSTTDMYFSVYGGSCASPGTAVICSDPESNIVTGLTIGNTYIIRVYSWTSTPGQTSAFDICVSSPGPPPANDECANATALTVNPDYSCGTTTAGTISSATASPQANDCLGTADDDVWYSFVATGPTHQVSLLNIVGSNTDMYFSVYGGSCASPGTAIICNDPNSAVVNGLTVGNTYYVRVYTWTSTPGQNTSFNICIGTPPPATAGQDCMLGITVCSDQQFSGNSSGFGNQELNLTNQGCLSDENESSWYLFSPQTQGTIELSITPQNWTDDYDFAIWGPYPAGSTAADICPPNQAPIRCSFSSMDGNTGLQIGSGDLTEGAGGDKWVDELVIGPAEVDAVYVMLIDNWSESFTPFTLDWDLTGVLLDCAVLPVMLLEAIANCGENGVSIHWTTASEFNNEKYTVFRSRDNSTWEEIGIISGAGNSNQKITYNFFDNVKTEGELYYKIEQTDFDGKTTTIANLPVHCYNISGFDIQAATVSSEEGLLYLTFNGRADETYVLELWDIAGKRIYTDAFSATTTGVNYTKTSVYLPSGALYIVSLRNTSGITKYRKVMIQ